jgi:hypothetical protein
MRRVAWSDVGALTSGSVVVATIFCCLPFAAGVIGTTIAGVGAQFEPYRPYLITISLVSLVYSFCGAYRRDPSCAVGICDVPRAVRYRRVIVWIVAVLVLVCVTAQWWANWIIYWTL